MSDSTEELEELLKQEEVKEDLSDMEIKIGKKIVMEDW